MSEKLSKKLKSERGIYLTLTALNPKTLEEMITDAEALEKRVEDAEKDAELWGLDHQKLAKKLEGCLAKCRDEANRLLMGISTPISPDDFDKLIDDMRQIGK